jgi:hypothetical protein
MTRSRGIRIAAVLAIVATALVAILSSDRDKTVAGIIAGVGAAAVIIFGTGATGTAEILIERVLDESVGERRAFSSLWALPQEGRSDRLIEQVSSPDSGSSTTASSPSRSRET